MENKFTWIPIYRELANSLLKYKDSREELVNWIYSELGEIKTSSKSSCVSYLKDVEKRKVKDIDPFSVFAIFNRGTTNEKRIEILSCFKRWFRLKSELPTEFDGVPVVNNMHSFFFTWDRNFRKVNDELWALFEHAVTDLDIKEPLDKLLHYERPFVMLTMGLYWINPEEFLSLDSRNVSFLEDYDFLADHRGWNAEDYLQTIREMKRSLGGEAMPFHSFPDISYSAWIYSNDGQRDVRVDNDVATYRRYTEIIALLKANRNLILTGAPGTGKTYMAKAIAEAMGTPREMRNFVQFHPSYDYTDFVEGLRPCQGEAGQVGFERKDGVFKAFCAEALSHDDPCVFIIDEINRGNISKIFGELFFSIDPGYRGEKGRVSTQYQNMVEDGDVFKEGFYVPDNVYIIGTMNDIDRSVDSMDFAMRRRFAWREVTAEESMQMLDGHADAEEAKARMQSLNRKIEQMPELGRQYQIGAAYFLKYEQYMDFEQLWDYHLKGLLFEYLRGERRVDEKMEELHNAYCLKTDSTDVDD